jgi:hypothetical protein
MSGPRGVPMSRCRACTFEVPAGRFCGHCGVRLIRHRGDGPDWLRLRSYGAAPTERVLLPSVTSSLFPLLPRHSRAPFRLGLSGLVAALALFVLMHWQACLVAVAALGLPVFLVVYLDESDAFHDLPTRLLAGSAGLGMLLGLGWALLTHDLVAAHFYRTTVGFAMAGDRVTLVGVVVPVGGAILMIVPAVVLRLAAPSSRESLDGFVIGMLGATCFTAAVTLTQLAPQTAAGAVDHDRPFGGLLVEAGIRGVTSPVIAAAVGGMVGAALWFQLWRSTSRQHRRVYAAILVTGFVALVCGYAAVGLSDVAPMGQGLHLGLYVAVTAVVVLGLRLTLQLTLLHEHHDTEYPDEPVLCPQCDHVVPDMAFCPSCGSAAQASSRSSRAPRRRNRPTPNETQSEGS